MSQLFADESKYKNDLNNDSHIGGIISSVVTDNQNFALYKIASGAYITDNSGLGIGDSSVSPTLLTQQVTLRGKTSTSLYDFSNTPTGALSFKDGSGVGVYYQDSKGAEWKRDSFDTNGVFKQTDSYSFAELLADETTYNIDLNKDGSVGDVVAEVLTNDGNGHGLYKTVSGLFVIDDSGLSVGSATTDPTILSKRSCVGRRRRVIMNLHKLQQGLFLIAMALVVCTIKIIKVIGLGSRLVQQVSLRRRKPIH